MAPPTLAVIIVSWNVRELLRRCLQATLQSLADSGLSFQIFVVDNASSDETAAMLRAEFPSVQLLEASQNLGFAGGNNLALRFLGFEQGKIGAEMVLLLNPDTLPIGDALPQLVSYLQNHPSVAAVGPKLYYPTGQTQPSRRRFPSRLTFFWESTILERLWPNNFWARAYRCADQSPEIEQKVDWLVGAALLVRGKAILEAGLLDEKFFMYSEELEWQKRLQQQKASIVYLPQAKVIHYEGKSSEQVPTAKQLYFQQSKIYLAQIWYGTVFAHFLCLFLWLSYAWELLLEGLKWLLGHRKSLRSQRIASYLTILRHLE